MDRNTREERLKQAQRIVARYVPKDRDLVSELIAERRAEAAAECSEATCVSEDLVAVNRQMQDSGGSPPASDHPITKAGTNANGQIRGR